MPGRVSPYNDAQNAVIASYIPAFEAKVLELDPELKGHNKNQLTQWKSVTAEEILIRPEFQALDDVKKTREVSTFSRTRHIILAN
jgi:hypothetical protein